MIISIKKSINDSYLHGVLGWKKLHSLPFLHAGQNLHLSFTFSSISAWLSAWPCSLCRMGKGKGKNGLNYEDSVVYIKVFRTFLILAVQKIEWNIYKINSNFYVSLFILLHCHTLNARCQKRMTNTDSISISELGIFP